MSEDLRFDNYLIKTDRSYMETHEWVKEIEPGIFLMGISDYAQKMLHEISYVQFEDPDEEFEEKDTIVVVEAIKASGDIYSPFKAKLLENNENLEDSPELINESPFEKGWLCKIKALSDSRTNLISPQQYLEIIKAESEE